MPRQPDIVWIVTTQWRAQACGYAGDANARTPWIDALASESTNFTQAVTPHPMGPHARAALLTGKLCPANGVSDYWDPLPVNARTIAHALNDRGYSTAFFGKWHLAERDRNSPFVGEEHAKMIVPKDRRGGFEFWEGFEGGFLINDPWLHGTRLAEPRQFKGYQSDVVAQRAAFWLREKRVQPTFCVISLEPPHPPYSAHVPHGIKRDPATLRLRENVPIGGEIESKAREELAGYYAHIEATDRAIGRLLAEIDLSNMAVVFTSVHGDMHGSHGVFRKAWPYEESVRIPLLVRFPTGICGKRDDPVSLVDLSRMALAWAGGTEWVLGRNYARISMPSGLKVLNQCPYGWRGIRTTTQKLILIEEDGELAEPTSVHYDLSSDPLESRNILFEREKSAEEAGLWRKLQHEARNR